ncbi:glycosyl transferase family 2 [Chryseobacterium sp. T16E-39]|uniref:glycosyltransferase family 2 protein n=1 Tax=Chryseobacterium sp. T16E-39 TaxID=2015076 RepID=UPI000B5B2AC8|nr:glycosyltransferase [Chryseobacterium sp. T16E-39]ASK32677.1 glycosyl transferase family 2 [Chryseobacterium sp. T16E-39]
MLKLKFSLLIANYNNGYFFRNCYDSIVKQKYSNWEAVIVDDGSTDGSVEIIEKLIGNDKRFRLYKNACNSGVSATKSKLIELAAGEICGFVDPDDALMPYAIHSAIFTYYLKRNVALTYSQYVKCDENLCPIGIPRNLMQVLNDDPYFFNSPLHISHFVTFKKSLYERTEKIDPSLNTAEDQDLYLKLYEKGKAYFIKEPNYLYRSHLGGISQFENASATREEFAKVIYNAMKRRGLKEINGRSIPVEYTTSNEIYDLLKYQTGIFFRIKKKIRLLLQKLD